MSTYVAKQPQGMKCVHVRIILENCINEFSQVDTTVQIQYQVEYPVLHCLINQNMGNQLVLSMSQLEKMPYLQKSKKYECLPNRALDTIYIYIYIFYLFIYIYILYIYIYINTTNGWIKKQDNSSRLLSVSFFLQSSDVHILHIRFPKRK